MKVLQVKNLHYGDILHGVHFDWQQGEIIALMGANGSGKSTVARLLAGLIEPEYGEICLTVDGIARDWNTVRRWQEVGLVGQHPRRQTIGATVAEELGFGLLNLGHDLHWVQNRVQELAASTGLAGKESQSPSTLSGGERQRLVTAAILALQPSFLIMDEALTMLDARAQANVLELLFQARDETGQLWITHDQELACQADRLLVIVNGEIVDKGNPQEALAEDELRMLLGMSEAPTHKKPSTPYVYHPTPQKEHVLDWRQAHYEARLSLNNVVRAGEFIGIVGPSGSGKTTLLESAVGLILPTEGQLFLCGKQLTQASVNSSRRQTRLVPQEAGEYLIGRSVYHEIYYGDSRQELKLNKQKKLLLLTKFGIPLKLAEVAPERLSGGERQKVALAAALRTCPEILLLDEPLLGLDATSRASIQQMISAWEDMTILYVTHDLREVLQDADRLWLVENGKVVLDCPIECWEEHQQQFRVAGVRC
ncbi:MAG TPA: ATP-binding cassette domain-containing protein [Desulfosporosinus sp.]